MRFSDLFEKWNISDIKVNAGVAQMTFSPDGADRDAAWELYVELLTRITTQPLADDAGIEKSALDSIYSLFAITREVLKKHGRTSQQFARIAIVVLNQKIRPFTAKWHAQSENDAFKDPMRCREFRSELSALKIDLQRYARLLADVADVEDMTDLEEDALL